MKKNAESHPVRFFEERPVRSRGQRLAADVAEQDHAVQFQIVNRAMKLIERVVRRVHWNRGEAFESLWMFGDEFGVGIVDRACDCWLVLCVCEEDVWS